MKLLAVLSLATVGLVMLGFGLGVIAITAAVGDE